MINRLIGKDLKTQFEERNYSSILNVDTHYIYRNLNITASQFGVILGLGSELPSINAALSGFSYNDVSDIKTTLEGFGYSLIMTPTYNAMAERMSSQTDITSIGRFNSDFFNNETLILSDGFDNANLNGYPFLAYAGFVNDTFYGTAVSFYTDYTSETPLKNLFTPNQNRNLYNYVLNANGSVVENDSSGTSTIFSDNQRPNSNGYNSTSRFSGDDGSHGFAIGTNRLDGNGGPYLSQNASNAYGCENRNSGDSSADEFFWGQQINTTSYCFYVFSKFVE